jgi:hypothetical protein
VSEVAERLQAERTYVGIYLYLFYNFDLMIKNPVLCEYRDLSCPDMVYNVEFQLP